MNVKYICDILDVLDKKDNYKLKELVNKNGFKEVRNDLGETPLFYALKQKFLEGANFLIDYSKDFNIVNRDNIHLFEAALETNNFEIIKKIFLKINPYYIDKITKENFLHKAVKMDLNLRIYQFLFENKNLSNYIGKRNIYGETPLILAINSIKSKKKLKYIIDKCKNFVNIRDAYETPLHYAVYRKEPWLVLYLIKKGANPNVKNSNGLTPMHLALKLGAHDVALFLRKYSDMEIKDSMGLKAQDLFDYEFAKDFSDKESKRLAKYYKLGLKNKKMIRNKKI